MLCAYFLSTENEDFINSLVSYTLKKLSIDKQVGLTQKLRKQAAFKSIVAG